MSNFIKVNDAGQVVGFVENGVSSDGFVAYDGDIPDSVFDCFLIDGVLRIPPSAAHEWNIKKKAWVLNAAKQAEFDAQALQEAKAEAIAASVKYADDLQASILGEASAAGQARLDNKYTAACAIKDGTATAGDNAVIDTEVAMRPKYNKAQLVDVIVAKGTAAKQAEGMINAMLLLAQDAINAAPTLAQLETTIAGLKTKADGLKAQIFAKIGGV